MKVPYMLVVGEKEMNENKVAVRRHGKGDVGVKPLDEFMDEIIEEIKERRSEQVSIQSSIKAEATTN